MKEAMKKDINNAEKVMLEYKTNAPEIVKKVDKLTKELQKINPYDQYTKLA